MATPPSGYDTASNHAAAVVTARASLVDEMSGKFFPRESLANVADFVDYMMARGYLTDKFYAAYAHGIEEDPDL